MFRSVCICAASSATYAIVVDHLLSAGSDLSLLQPSVPNFFDLGGKRHPVVNNFPLSHLIFKVNFPLSNDPLALVSAKL